MHLVADLHIHSHFSRATSKDLTLEQLWRWAQLKGVDVVATGDIAHPGWLLELSERLTPAEDGLFTLKPEYTEAAGRDLPAACRRPVRFLLGGEISNIYKRGGKTRKVHNLVFLPTLDAVARLQTRLERIGNIRADGRPILGLDSRDCWRSCWRPTRAATSSPPTSGRPGSPCSAPCPASTAWRSASPT
jgi:DNA helicase-2/ATP-dependent DNA helicase PcrA